MIDPSDGSIDEVAMYNGDVVTSHGLNLCVDADQACYDLMNEIRNAKMVTVSVSVKICTVVI